jgi:pimeloyl-ACP methyl ester carboxylesterase
MFLVRLHLREYPGPAESAPILLVHGLFGSGTNWHGIARRLAQTRPLLVPDLRNHGESPWDAVMDYPAMAADLAALLDARGIAAAHLVGHSMGGKAAMCLALARPERVRSLAVVDIAPIAYESRFGALVDALQALPLEDLRDRRDADARLAAVVSSAAVRGYLLQNLAYDADQGLRWRLNLPAIADSLNQILGFPDAQGRQFAGPTLFVYGSRSDYVGADGLDRIRALFPLARLRAIPNAGHWVYADQPDAFLAALTGFLKD